MKISQEEYNKALLIVLQYESQISNNERETLKRENYKKSIDEMLPNGLKNMILILNQIDDLGIDLKMTVAEFILLNINWEHYFKIRNFGSARKNRFRSFLKEYQIK